MANRLCQFSTLPSIILDSEGIILQHNRPFAAFWNVDDSKLFGANKYNIFNDPFYRRKDRQTALQRAFHGTPTKFEALGYQFPAEYSKQDQTEAEKQLKAIFVAPCAAEQSPAVVAVYYQTESSLLPGENGAEPCEKVASLTAALSDLKHEISNPLLLIIGHAQLLLAKSDRLPAEAVKKLEKILHSAEKIRGLMQEKQDLADLLQVSDEYGVVE